MRRPPALLAPLLAVPALVLVLLVAAGWAPLAAVDLAGSDAVRSLAGRHPQLGTAGRLVEAWTQPWVWWVATAVAAVVALARGARRAVLVVVVAVACAGVASPLLKALLGRARPALDPLLTTASGGSWPSGHVLAATTVTGCALVALGPRLRAGWRRAAGAAGAAGVRVVVDDRLLVGADWPSDVVGSASL
ncbi:phosphatase PAP2 family protein, partial [Kineococcus glutinatus]|uniref:phosphatase PAP2 family protein n=1 Tax=Kineococcus glutinatus TaxID=1070872 RepID=UPI0031ED24A0